MTDPTRPAPYQPVTVTLQPMVHVEDMHAAVVFYEALGARVLNGSRDGDFVLLAIGGSQLSLLAHPPNPEQDEGKVELNFETAEPLADLEQKLRDDGVTIVRSASAEGFGEQLQIAAPDGLLVKINKLEPDRYG
jgi:catechol 2,3-dioxygenase-like lactoylglutathione lyase family enzyme